MLEKGDNNICVGTANSQIEEVYFQCSCCEKTYEGPKDFVTNLKRVMKECGDIESEFEFEDKHVKNNKELSPSKNHSHVLP